MKLSPFAVIVAVALGIMAGNLIKNAHEHPTSPKALTSATYPNTPIDGPDGCITHETAQTADGPVRIEPSMLRYFYAHDDKYRDWLRENRVTTTQVFYGECEDTKGKP